MKVTINVDNLGKLTRTIHDKVATFDGRSYVFVRDKLQYITCEVYEFGDEFVIMLSVPSNSTQTFSLQKLLTIYIDCNPIKGLKETIIFGFRIVKNKITQININNIFEYYRILLNLDFYTIISWTFFPRQTRPSSDPKPWLQNQIDIRTGNKLPMCWTNYDLMIKYK